MAKLLRNVSRISHKVDIEWVGGECDYNGTQKTDSENRAIVFDNARPFA